MHPDAQTPYQTKELDPRWTAVDHYAISHLHPANSPYHAALNHAAHLQHSRGLPDIAVSPLQGSFLAMQCRLMNISHVLEIGTLGGYSTIWLASADPGIRITTIEVSESHAAVAHEAFEYAGISDRVEIIVGSGREVLPRLQEEVDEGKREKFGFVFVDADKPNNAFYLDKSVGLTKRRGCIIVDNVVRKGTLAREDLAVDDPKA
ncbi:hypothetical protein MBLNU457_3318t2 [Dothideomycetes sp. NU457]